MEYLDYSSALFLTFLRRRFSGAAGPSTIFKVGDFVEFASQQLGRKSPISRADAVATAERLSHHMALEIYSTPHAENRFHILKADFNRFDSVLGVDQGGIAQASRHYRSLGAEWLLESLLGSKGEQSSPTDKSALTTSVREAADEWEPLPIHRPDAELAQAVEAIEALQSVVTADNGYSANYPAERDEVRSRLGTAVGYLNTASLVTYTAIEAFVVWPIQRALKRFDANTIVGEAARLAKDIFVAWLKKRGGSILDDWFS